MGVVVLVFVAGIVWAPLFTGQDSTVPVAPAVVYSPLTPIAGETHAVLSLQLLRADETPDHRCTATLIDDGSPNGDWSVWALTAAHCITHIPAEIARDRGSSTSDVNPETASFLVRGASPEYARGGQTATVIDRYVYSGWNWRRTVGAPSHDIALLRLDRAMTIKPIPLATTDVPDGSFTLVYGWSVNANQDSELSPTLQQFPLRTQHCPNEPAATLEMCATTANAAAGPCGGVSGGPIVSLDTREHPTLLGVYSFSRGRYCGEHPMFFTSVPDYHQWLLTTMASPS